MDAFERVGGVFEAFREGAVREIVANFLESLGLDCRPDIVEDRGVDEVRLRCRHDMQDEAAAGGADEDRARYAERGACGDDVAAFDNDIIVGGIVVPRGSPRPR